MANRETSSALEHHMQPEIIRVSILDIPDDILRRIILYLDARERVMLGNSCTRFNSLAFEDPELLRDLDFSKQVHLTSETDIQQYFDNENTWKHLRKLNIRNVKCIKPGYALENSVGKALNLVDINIHGTEFTDMWHLCEPGTRPAPINLIFIILIDFRRVPGSHRYMWQFGSFLNPLIHLQRLSIDWPNMKDVNTSWCCKILQRPFGRLIYLSVKIEIHCLKVFAPTLRLCHQLEKLLLMVVDKLAVPGLHNTYNDIWGGEIKELQNLKIVQYCGPFVRRIKELFVTMLPDPEKWTDFQLNDRAEPAGFYLEKNVEVCEELLACKSTEYSSHPAWNHSNLEWVLFPECLLKELLRIRHTNIPEAFCCLSTFLDAKRCLLTIQDAKMLLKNPRHQISYLYLNHTIEMGCDVHIVASAFSNLTSLVLSSVITRDWESVMADTNFETRRRRRVSAELEEPRESMNMDSSFKMLVENTPRLKHFVLIGSDRAGNWDLDALYLISGWKSLKILCLRHIPINDGYFLIEIGKQCKRLQKIDLRRLGPSDACCYKKELLQIPKLCRNLYVLMIEADSIVHLSDIFRSLVNNLQRIQVFVQNQCDSSHTNLLILSMKWLFDQCSRLTKFILEFNAPSPIDVVKLKSAVERFTDQFKNRNLQIQVVYVEDRSSQKKTIGTIYQHASDPKPFPHMLLAN